MGFQENDKIRTCSDPWQGNSHQEEWAWTSSSNHPLASLTLNLFLHNSPKYQHNKPIHINRVFFVSDSL